MTTLELSIKGMTCGGCSSSLTGLLEKTPGISAVSVSHENGSGKMAIDEAVISKNQVMDIIKKAGYEVTG